MKAGAQDYLVKGQFEPRSLSRTLQSAIERHRMMRELQNAKEREHYLATHDALTDLPNRFLFWDRLAQAIATAERARRNIAVMFLDLDRFKNVNDQLGHAAGDEMLKVTAQRVGKNLRATDTAAHLSGDEFAFILYGVTRPIDAAKVAKSIMHSVSQPVQISGSEVIVTASMGIAIYPEDGRDPDTLIRNADAAMYKAKQEGRNHYVFYGPALNSRAVERFSIESELRKALDLDQFELHYQPIVDGVTGRVFAAEALVRWRHPDLGLVPPGDFIPLAEDTGLIVPIGEWVLREACSQFRAWEQMGLALESIAVNTSPRQFWSASFDEVVLDSLSETGLPGSKLCLEITESCVMRDVDSTIAILSSVKDAGVGVSLDDFGTGYSSLASLSRFPLNQLKIDRSFVNQCVEQEIDATITSAIIALGCSLGLEIVAEGVETLEQRDFLLERNCNTMQGYLFSPPVESDTFRDILTRGRIDVEKEQPG